MLGMREEPVLFKHLRQVDEDGSIAFASFEARTGEESIAMALEPRCLDLGDFLVDHFLRDGGFAELCFVECVALGVLRYHIEFADGPDMPGAMTTEGGGTTTAGSQSRDTTGTEHFTLTPAEACTQ